MNNILQLKGEFKSRSNVAAGGLNGLPPGASVKVIHINELKQQLLNILEYWDSIELINNVLINVKHIRVIPKSNRLRILLSLKDSESPNKFIKGAKFELSYSNNIKRQKHVFTYYIDRDSIRRTIKLLETAATIITEHYNGDITSKNTDNIIKNHIYLTQDIMPYTKFIKVILDCYYTESFNLVDNSKNYNEDSIITIYETEQNTSALMANIGIKVAPSNIINDNTMKLSVVELNKLKEKAPYLISMSVSDLSEFSIDNYDNSLHKEENNMIAQPTNEPIIGVIDTHFSKSVYFKDWVEYITEVDEDTLNEEDYMHGTAISSIIIDGPRGNPDLEDGCGHFRVRHFGIARHGALSSFEFMKKIRNIIQENLDIKVWNLSLGSRLEINENYISPEAAEIDKIQFEFDVIFIISGTNKINDDKNDMKIGAPADSLNSIIVNSVTRQNEAVSYARQGPVLSFFNKPDVSYYGGKNNRSDYIIVCDKDNGSRNVYGTSFAAPWITRKIAYMIYKLGLSREVAKALIIDSAMGWNNRYDKKIGYGIVPKHIKDIIQSPDDEIKFILTGVAEEYETYTYNLPVPIHNDKYPFWAKAVMVYFPVCDRNQGVDYTTTEMELKFGRVKYNDKKNQDSIQDIKNNKQDEVDISNPYEEDARRLYRKWDNVKVLVEKITDRISPRKVFLGKMWGISVKTKERVAKEKDKLKFAIVITLKEMMGKNRIEEFIAQCSARGWLVRELNVEKQITIYNKAEETIELE